jgi:2-keto-4-pentenoate hydratase/2-oxohepta-3-ene-1,7-dioic acid hydratase in catechol pathway
VPDTPVVFLKPVSSLIDESSPILLPGQSGDVQHEVELVLVIGREGKFIPIEATPDYIAGFGVGIDVTARDLQREAKKGGLPWTLAKGFDTFGALSQIMPFTDWNSLRNETLSLTVNGETRQSAPLTDMIFNPGALISYLSTIFTLSAGDIIFTGTPEGVAPINQGDQLHASLGKHIEAKFHVHNIPE